MNHRPSGRNPWLPHRPSADAVARVFLIPYSGCGASMYRQWPRHRDGVDFVPVELPGHETRFAEPNFTTYQELAQAMIPGLEDHLDVPFAFFGHCGSALAAYEVSAELARTGKPAASQLYVSSEVAPQDGPAGRFLSMDDTELTAELEGLMRRLGGNPSPDILSFYLEILRADVDTNKRYIVPDPFRLPGPITAIGWTEDDEIPYADMTGWKKCGETTAVLLEGHHHKFMEAPDSLLDLMAANLLTAAGR
ncbi:thioesterase II family protein [Streptomyces sp. DSM 110735]|uniref:thioesterase II family protein n=1 Tax=Streptomyces sp. DSM 110735 TaxID=2775031 RepID=UPI0018F57A5F|nr:thioesterase [Streptomyces sp. DSM 110735]MBJ7903855.1 thioesterase [Streptomyces sp. DSM 110735]